MLAQRTAEGGRQSLEVNGVHLRRDDALGRRPDALSRFILQSVVDRTNRPSPARDRKFSITSALSIAAHIEGATLNNRMAMRSLAGRAVLAFLHQEGVRIIQTPFRAPNCNAYAERFVRSIKEECLARVILLGERHLRCTIAEFVTHYQASGTIKASVTS